MNPYDPVVEQESEVNAAWVMVAMLVLAACARLALDLRRDERAAVEGLSGAGFELRLAELFVELGYDVRLVAHGRGELVVEKDGRRAVVQSLRPGLAGVGLASAARGRYATDDAIVVSRRGFGLPARRRAERAGVELWDLRHRLPH
jgi:HJR/Mrr/RecB family endonuclease